MCSVLILAIMIHLVFLRGLRQCKIPSSSSCVFNVVYLRNLAYHILSVLLSNGGRIGSWKVLHLADYILKSVMLLYAIILSHG